MKNYYELLAYADRKDLLLEKARDKFYIGFKDGDNSKTLFVLPDDEEKAETFLNTLAKTKYKESALYKLVAKGLIKNIIESSEFCDTYDIEHFSKLSGYNLTDEDYKNIENTYGIVYDKKNEQFCHKSYYKKRVLLDNIFNEKEIYITKNNMREIESILPRFNNVLNDEDMEEHFIDDVSTVHDHYSEDILVDSVNYWDIDDDINKLFKLFINNEISITYESLELKKHITKFVFNVLSSSSEILDAHCCIDFNGDYLNYYNLFYDGKVIL